MDRRVIVLGLRLYLFTKVVSYLDLSPRRKEGYKIDEHPNPFHEGEESGALIYSSCLFRTKVDYTSHLLLINESDQATFIHVCITSYLIVNWFII